MLAELQHRKAALHHIRKMIHHGSMGAMAGMEDEKGPSDHEEHADHEQPNVEERVSPEHGAGAVPDEHEDIHIPPPPHKGISGVKELMAAKGEPEEGEPAEPKAKHSAKAWDDESEAPAGMHDDLVKGLTERAKKFKIH